jgi:hypothetical protein
MPNVTIEYYGVTGTGRNVTEAKRDAGEQIRKALDGDYTPSLIHWRQYTVLMARDPKFGWGYRISHAAEQGETIRERMWLNTNGETQEACLLALVKHIGDIARPTGEDPKATKPLFDILRGTEAANAYRDFRQSCQRNDQFHLRYRHAIDVLHMKEGDAHAWAGMNPSTYDTWKGTEFMFHEPAWEQSA